MKYVDMHCDTITSLYRSNGSLLNNDLHIDLNKLRKGECLLQNFAIFTNIEKEDSSFTKAAIDYYYKQLEENKDLIKPVFSYDDIIENEKEFQAKGPLCFKVQRKEREKLFLEIKVP